MTASSAPDLPELASLSPLPRQRILSVGQGFIHGTCHHRYRALLDLGHDCEFLELIRRPIPRWRHLWARLADRAFCRGLNWVTPPDLGDVNRILLRKATSGQSYDILWLDKALSVRRHTLERFRDLQPHCRIVGYSPDDMGRRHNLSRPFLEHLPLYDLFFTTKSYNVSELETAGAPRVLFVDNAYDSYDHHPFPVDETSRVRLGGAVGFVGSHEEERAGLIHTLAAAEVPVRVWGNGWQALNAPPQALHLEHKPLFGADYAAAMQAFDINLCFLRKANRDLQTTRSIEIPACGGFMLAERSAEHQRLFQEGEEAEFFSDGAELLDKARYYLAHPEQRQRIAAAGRRRCLEGGYSNHHRMHDMVRQVLAL